MGRALRFLLKWLIILAVVGFVAAGAFVLRSPDPEYTAYEFVYNARFHRYDPIIEEVSRQRGVDPMVIKAVVWRESRFRPDKVGLDGERGLMQITDAAAREWVKNEKVANYAPSDLFDPKVNIQAGSWLLARSLRRYGAKDDPLPFALAEYNAGHSRVVKWTRDREKAIRPSPARASTASNFRRTSTSPARKVTSRPCRTACSFTIVAVGYSVAPPTVRARGEKRWSSAARSRPRPRR